MYMLCMLCICCMYDMFGMICCMYDLSNLSDLSERCNLYVQTEVYSKKITRAVKTGIKGDPTTAPALVLVKLYLRFSPYYP